VNGSGSNASRVDDAAVAVPTCVSSAASFADVFVVVVTVVTDVGGVVVYILPFSAVLFAGATVVVASLNGNGADGAVLAFRGVVLDAVITAFTAVILAFELDAFSRHFFFWERFPCPDPGILSVRDNKKN
jgi:ABC-type Fe3+-siderophore transport system permease subunit